MEYDNRNKFVLFPNDKGDNPKRPDYTGTVNIEGVVYELSGWKGVSKSGKPYLNGQVKKKDAEPGQAPPPQTPEPEPPTPQSREEIPF